MSAMLFHFFSFSYDFFFEFFVFVFNDKCALLIFISINMYRPGDTLTYEIQFSASSLPLQTQEILVSFVSSINLPSSSL